MRYAVLHIDILFNWTSTIVHIYVMRVVNVNMARIARITSALINA